MRSRMRIVLFAAIAVAASVLVFSRPPIPQDPAYHLFADGRTFFAIPNFFDVASNLPFLLAGVLGLMFIAGRGRRQRGNGNRSFSEAATDDGYPSSAAASFSRGSAGAAASFSRGFVGATAEDSERWPYVVFFLGVALTCFGSAYYHWTPTNATLLWDRLPMTLGFMGILAGTIGDRIGGRAGRLCLAPLLLLGLGSVLYWHVTELRGAGDLRLYGVVQFFPLVAVPLLLVLFPARYTHAALLLAAGGFYVLAKVLELLDRPIFNAAGISGHSLKHLAAALAAFCVLRMLQRRTLAGARAA